jgi:hypothetical protein
VAERIVIGEQHLNGNAPGAAPVTITVEGRELVIPRCALISLVTLAQNAAYDEQKKAEAVPVGSFKDRMDLDNHLEGIAYYRESYERADAIHKFLSSR